MKYVLALGCFVAYLVAAIGVAHPLATLVLFIAFLGAVQYIERRLT